MARLSWTAKAGIALIAAPCLWLASWAVWHFTRNWIPVRLSLSGEAGHLRTDEFKINLEGDYSIGLAKDAGAQACAERLGAPWALSKHGSVVAAGKGELNTALWWPVWACAIGRFHANTGAYRLDLDVSKHPTLLIVYEDGGQFINSTACGAHAFETCVILLPIALATLIIAAIRRREEGRADAARQWILTQPGPIPGAPIPGTPVKISPRRKPKTIAPWSFSVAGRFNLNLHISSIVQVLMPLSVVVALAMPLPWRPAGGFVIRTVRPGVKLMPTAGITPLRIRVLGDQRSMRGLQVAAQLIDRAHFPEFLRREIPKRPSDWPVYIEADRDNEFESVAWTIDAVSAFGAKVILLTPGLRTDLGESAR